MQFFGLRADFGDIDTLLRSGFKALRSNSLSDPNTEFCLPEQRIRVF